MSSSLPDSVQQQADKAEEIQKQIVEGNTGEETLNQDGNTSPPEGDAPETNENTLDPTPATDPATEEPANVSTTDVVTPADLPADGQPVVTPEDETWKHKYEVLEGKYSVEKPMLQNQVNVLTGQMQMLQNENMNLKQQLDQAQQQPGTAAEGSTTMPDPESFQQYGDEFVEMANKLKNLEGSIGTIQQQTQRVEENRAKDVWDGFWKDLNDDPNFQKFNEDPGFIGWLNTTSPYTGQVRNASLQLANQHADLGRVKAIFQEYADIQAKVTPPKPEPKPTPNPIDNISPSPARGVTNTPAPVQGKTYTKADITQFYTAVAQGKYNGQEDLVAQTQADMLAAHNEGRIVDNF